FCHPVIGIFDISYSLWIVRYLRVFAVFAEMMRNVNIMRNMKFGFEETDENDRNPDWDQAFEQTGLGDKIREMNDLQLEGADVYMSTFAQLKGYPFFREPLNWFYPFDRMHSSIIHQVGL
ncbi:hypothetical protein PZH42_26930, partial [Bacteroides cellulosilyticus]|nr:hypothetical protein [Bacteroides cellulosilyticus]